MTAVIEQYKRSLKRHLHCDRITKRHLMARFESTLNVYLDDFGWPTAWPNRQDLENAFGPPEQMAELLSSEIPLELKARYAKAGKIRRAVLIVLIALLLLFSIYTFFIKQKPLTSVDEGIVYPTVPSPSTSAS